MESCSGTLPTSKIENKIENDKKAFMDKIKERYKKIIVGGESGVGKQTLLIRYIEGWFSAETKMTIGVEFSDKTEIIENKKINFIFWSLGGNERFRFFISDFCRGADAAIFAFELARTMTLENLEQWVKILRSDNPYLPILVVGTKADLVDKVTIQEDYIKMYQEKLNLFDYITVSSKTGENVEKVFDTIFKCALHKDIYEKFVESKRFAELELKKKIEERIPFVENLIREGKFKDIERELKDIRSDAWKYMITDNLVKQLDEKIKIGKELEKKKVIKKTILDLGIKFQRLQIMEIAEECGLDANLIESVVQEMITNKEIYAKYFTSSKSVAFDQQANIVEIDKLMATYKEWEDKKVGKK